MDSRALFVELNVVLELFPVEWPVLLARLPFRELALIGDTDFIQGGVDGYAHGLHDETGMLAIGPLNRKTI